MKGDWRKMRQQSDMWVKEGCSRRTANALVAANVWSMKEAAPLIQRRSLHVVKNIGRRAVGEVLWVFYRRGGIGEVWAI